jgi:hypothetical protein
VRGTGLDAGSRIEQGAAHTQEGTAAAAVPLLPIASCLEGGYISLEALAAAAAAAAACRSPLAMQPMPATPPNLRQRHVMTSERGRCCFERQRASSGGKDRSGSSRLGCRRRGTRAPRAEATPRSRFFGGLCHPWVPPVWGWWGLSERRARASDGVRRPSAIDPLATVRTPCQDEGGLGFTNETANFGPRSPSKQQQAGGPGSPADARLKSAQVGGGSLK